MSLYGYIGTLIACVIAYLIGSFSWSLFVGRFFYNIDIRKYYSRNAGATNLSRILGKKWGFTIVGLDMLKVTIAMFIAFGISCIKINDISFESTSYYIPGFFVLIGHAWPIYYGFKGGKTVSSFLGLLWMTNPFFFLISAVVWWSTIFIWKKVSISSILSAFAIGALCWIPQLSDLTYITFLPTSDNGTTYLWFNKLHSYNNDYYDSIGLICVIITISATLLIGKHHQNIARIVKNQEPKYNFKSKIDKDLLQKHNRKEEIKKYQRVKNKDQKKSL